MRKLVTIRTVDAINPIPNADAIECATVEGWSVVVKKGEFDVGSRCLFFEIDSFLPIEDARFGFLAKNKINWEGREGIRLRTIKLRGQLSQGLILALDAFPELVEAIDSKPVAQLRETDFSEALNVVKWEAPIPASLSGEVEGGFPSFIRKTDQERIQNLPEVFAKELDSRFEISVKLDGASMTVFHNDGQTGVCGRNWWLKETDNNSLWRIARQDALVESLARYGNNLALQGEIIGEGIQGNPEKIRGQDFYLFDIYNIDTQTYLSLEDKRRAVDDLKSLGATLKEVPSIGVEKLSDIATGLDALLAYADGPSLNPDTRREGVVFKKVGARLSFKVISNWYLLKHSDR